MNAVTVALLFTTIAAPLAAFLVILLRVRRAIAEGERRPERLKLSLVTVGFGALFFVPGWLLEGSLQRWSGLDEHARIADLASLVYAFFVAAPLEQGLKVAAVAPVWRSRYFTDKLDGLAYASAAGLGFISAHNLEYLLSEGASPLHVARALLAVPAHVFFAAAWGFALGAAARRNARAGERASRLTQLGGRAFNLTWLMAMLFNGIFDHLVFARGPVALIATTPILLCMIVLAYAGARDVLKSAALASASSRPKRRFSIAPPSIGAVREALSRADRPVMIGWIGVGALVQAGVMTTALAGAIALGHRIGVDFAAVDRGDSSAAAGVAPLVLLGGAALGAFPIAGYLIARASSTRSVLEPAISAAVAIAGTLLLLGLAAPIAVVFAMAFAPVAFGLACAGAWVGIAR